MKKIILSLLAATSLSLAQVSLTDDFNRTGPLNSSMTSTGGFTWSASSGYTTSSNDATAPGSDIASINFTSNPAIYDLSVSLDWTAGSSWSHSGIYLFTPSINIGRIGVRQVGYTFGVTDDASSTLTFQDLSTTYTGPVTLQIIYDNLTNNAAPTLVQKINGATVGTHTFASAQGAITGFSLYGDVSHRFDNLTFTASVPEPSHLTWLALPLLFTAAVRRRLRKASIA